MVTKEKVHAFLKSWSHGLQQIQKTYLDNGDYQTKAKDFIKTHYLFDEENVFFKPTMTKENIFRNNSKGALSYFIGNDISEDQGFALSCEHVEIGMVNVLIEDGLISASGLFDFKITNIDENTKVAFTFVLKETHSGLKIKIHHSSPV